MQRLEGISSVTFHTWLCNVVWRIHKCSATPTVARTLPVINQKRAYKVFYLSRVVLLSTQHFEILPGSFTDRGLG